MSSVSARDEHAATEIGNCPQFPLGIEEAAGLGQTTAQPCPLCLAGRIAGRYLKLTRLSHQLTVEARNRPAITGLHLLAVLNVGFKYARIV